MRAGAYLLNQIGLASFLSVMLVLGVGTRASAQSPLLEDDFEGSTLFSSQIPPGQWTYMVGGGLGLSVSISTASAHRGSQGLLLVDSSTSGVTAALEKAFPSPVTGAFYGRVWLRLRSASPTAEFIWCQTYANTFLVNSMLDLWAYMPGGSLEVQGPDQTGSWKVDPRNYSLGSNQWHLLEWALDGVGTDGGSRALWIDGNPADLRSGLDYTGLSVVSTEIGEPWSDNALFEGNVDFDDVRMDVNPLASGFQLSAQSPVNGCSPIQVQLVSSATNSQAGAPYAFAASLFMDGGAMFSDSNCSSPATTVSFPAGASTEMVYATAPPTTAGVLTASYVDFLPGSVALGASSSPDAGSGVPQDAGFEDAGSGLPPNPGSPGPGSSNLIPTRSAYAFGCSTGFAEQAASPFTVAVTFLLGLGLARKRRTAAHRIPVDRHGRRSGE
jgi:hypothetical protein